MKKVILIIAVVCLLLGCKNQNLTSEIANYVKVVDNRTDLSESITEFTTEDTDGVVVGGINIYELADDSGEIFRMVADIGQPEQSPGHYKFYYRQNALVYARILEFNEAGTDTIMDSIYYFDGDDLIDDIGIKKIHMHPESVLEVSKFYLAYGKTSD